MNLYFSRSQRRLKWIERHSALILVGAALALGPGLGWFSSWIATLTSFDAGQVAIVTVLVVLGLIGGTLLAMVAARVRHLGAAPGVCEKCGYDMRATRFRCPECGDVWMWRRPR